jgi:hypothetical protein
MALPQIDTLAEHVRKSNTSIFFSSVAPRLKRFNTKSLFKNQNSVLVLTIQQIKPMGPQVMFMPFSVSRTAMMYHELNTATSPSTYA